MKGITIKAPRIQDVLTKLKDADAIDHSVCPKKEGDTLSVAVIETNVPGELLDDVIEIELTKKPLLVDFKTELAKILTEQELDLVKTAYDIVGTIAILEVDEVLSHKAKEIAQTLLKSNSALKTVVRKGGAHSGELRIQGYDYLAGEQTMETLHKENGCFLHIILDEVYYSARSSTERKRVFSQIKKEESVLVMFSGCGPFVCTIAKNSPAKYVVGIELNDVGHELSVRSAKKNKLSTVDLIQGDVKQVCPELKYKGLVFDRIIMPLPKTADEFLAEAFMLAKPGTIIHLYDFVDEREFPQVTIDKIEKCAKYCGIEYDIVDSVKCGQFAPYIFRVCVDFKIKKMSS